MWILIVLFAVVMVLGPIKLLIPSKAQKKREALRLFARQLGLLFTQRKIPTINPENENPYLGCVYFLSPVETEAREDWILLPADFEHELHLNKNWSWLGTPRAKQTEISLLEKFLLTAVPGVLAVSGGRSGYCVYWSEKGDEKDLKKISEFLHQLKSLQS